MVFEQSSAFICILYDCLLAYIMYINKRLRCILFEATSFVVVKQYSNKQLVYL